MGDNLARGTIWQKGQSGLGGQSGKGTLEPIKSDSKSPCHLSLKIMSSVTNRQCYMSLGGHVTCHKKSYVICY